MLSSLKNGSIDARRAALQFGLGHESSLLAKLSFNALPKIRGEL